MVDTGGLLGLIMVDYGRYCISLRMFKVKKMPKNDGGKKVTVNEWFII